MSMQYRSEVPTVSEYEPITKELYEMMYFHHGPYSDEVDTVSADYEQFYLACTKIDSIHAKLEDENQSLKNIIAKLKHNTTVMELFCKNLEDAVKERKDVTLWGVDYIPVPVDADNMPVHNGDVMEWPDGKTFEVIGIGDGVLFYTEHECDGPAEWTGASTKRHYHAPTVEDVLREFAAGFVGCANCVNDHEVTDAIELFAPKLRLAGDVE